MRSYVQYCGLALALDQVGERWTLLIIRELLTGPKRYADLAAGLPGVATNLLAARLRSLEQKGLVVRRPLPPATETLVYVLTESGQELAEPVRALIRWGGRFMRQRSRRQVFRPQWLSVALGAVLARGALPSTPLLVRFEVPEGSALIEFGPRHVLPRTDTGTPPDVRVRAAALIVLGLAAGELSWSAAVRAGLDIDGAPDPVGAFRKMFRRDGSGRGRAAAPQRE